MQLHRLRLQNFRQHELTDLVFGPGLTGIVGPNGAGKTTLLEAIAYALYGVPGTRGTRETLRRRGAPPRARFEVLLEFSLGMHRYTVTRTLTNAELTQDGQVIANSTGTVTERTSAILGMNRFEFFNTYFTGQKELAVMASLGRVERAQFLSRVIGHEKLKDAQERLRTERSGLRSQLEGIEQGLADPDALEADLASAVAMLETSRAERASALAREEAATQRLAQLTPAWLAARDRRTAWQALDGERRLLDKRVAVARTRFQAIDQQLAAALNARNRVAELVDAVREWGELVSERDALDQAAQAAALRSRGVARRDESRRRVVELTAQVAALPGEDAVRLLREQHEEALRNRDASGALLRERRTRWTEDVQEARTKLEAFRDRYRELKEQRDLVEQNGSEGICPTCGRPLGDGFRTMLDLLERQIEEVLTDGKYFGARVAQLADAPAEVRERDSAFLEQEAALRLATDALSQGEAQWRQREAMEVEARRLAAEAAQLDHELAGPAASYDGLRHEVVRNALAALEPRRREHDQVAGVAARAELLLADAALAEQQATVAESELVAIDERMTALGWDPVQFAATETAIHEAELSLQTAQVAVRASATAQGRAETLRESALARQADRAAKADTARRLGQDITLLDELDRAFSDLRTELNLQLRPELQERASQLIDALTAGRYTEIELDESYVPLLVEGNEVKPVISGGEDDLVNLALRLAISEMIADRVGQPLSLLVLDEIFGSLDEDRRGSVMALLRSLSDRFPQVILITHVEGLHDAFDRVIRIDYDVARAVSVVADDSEVLDVAV